MVSSKRALNEIENIFPSSAIKQDTQNEIDQPFQNFIGYRYTDCRKEKNRVHGKRRLSTLGI